MGHLKLQRKRQHDKIDCHTARNLGYLIGWDTCSTWHHKPVSHMAMRDWHWLFVKGVDLVVEWLFVAANRHPSASEAPARPVDPMRSAGRSAWVALNSRQPVDRGVIAIYTADYSLYKISKQASIVPAWYSGLGWSVAEMFPILPSTSHILDNLG